MKTAVLLLSFLLFALSTYGLDPVLDAAGEEVQTGVGYYVLPHIWAMGGGLAPGRNRNGSTCPFDVVQSPYEVDNGFPVAFSPILDKESVVRVSADIDIKFTITTICPQYSTVWDLGDYDDSGRIFIITGGVGGSVTKRFRIEKYSEIASLSLYKLVHCQARRVCQNIGIFRENRVRRLAVSDEPYLVVFVKAEDSQIKKITARHNIY